jgi:hypothetical protein
MDCEPGCPEEDQQLMAASQVAAGMRAHVPQTRHAALRAFVTQVIAHQQNAQKRAYWRQVREYLED